MNWGLIYPLAKDPRSLLHMHTLSKHAKIAWLTRHNPCLLLAVFLYQLPIDAMKGSRKYMHILCNSAVFVRQDPLNIMVVMISIYSLVVNRGASKIRNHAEYIRLLLIGNRKGNIYCYCWFIPHLLHCMLWQINIYLNQGMSMCTQIYTTLHGWTISYRYSCYPWWVVL